MQLTILLATYNGEKYLKEQLDSLIVQSYTEWTLLVHDDGSTDGTLDILRSYAQNDQRIRLLEDGITGLGAAGNFLHLLKHTEADLTMFCDQDDIWLPDKVDVMVKSIDPSGMPAMSYCNASSYKDGNVLPDKVILFHTTHLRDTLFLNGGIHSCLQIINKPLRDLVLEYKGYVCMHDHLTTLAAVSFGTIKYVDRTLMYYRQHTENVTLGYETNVIRKIKNFFKPASSVIDTDHYRGTIEFYDHYKSKMSSVQQAFFLAYCRFAKAPLWERVAILFRYRFKIGRTNTILLLKTLMRKPMGKK